MTTIATVKIPVRMPGANEYIAQERRSRYAGAKLKQEYTSLAALYFRRAGAAGVTGPVKIRFTWHEPNRRRDKDNVAYAKKYILDGMQRARFLPNDNNRWITGFEDRFVYGGWCGVEIEVMGDDELA